ncbi:MAG: hypothetical protein ACJ760_05810 [Thermoleophilaceae bacterium]
MSRDFATRIRRLDPLTLAVGVAAALPVIVSSVRAATGGWIALSDDAMMLVRALDVPTTHSPLVGAHSASSSIIGEAVAGWGPMLFWLFALPARLGQVAPAIAAGIVNMACVVGIVALARRRGGVVLMLAVAAGLALACRSLEAQIYHDVWNASAVLLPFTLLVFLAWSVACGELALLPLMVVVGSFATQCQVTYALPVALLFAIALGFAVARREAVSRRIVVTTLAALLVCWSLPIVDEALHRPGNMEQVVRVATADAHRFGWRAGWHTVQHTVGVPPWWLQPQHDAFARLADVGFGRSAAAIASTVAILAALVAALIVALRRRERELAAGLALAAALCLAAAAVTSQTPTEHGLFVTIDYTLRWTSFAGMFVWVVLAWAVVNLLRPVRRVDALRPAAAVAAVAAVAVVGALVAGGERPDPRQRWYAPVDRLAERVRDAVPAGGTVQVEGPSPAAGLSAGPEVDVTATVAYELRRHGVDFVTDDVIGIGHHYDPGGRHYASVVHIEPDAPGSPPAGRVIARAVLPGAPAPGNRVVATLEP